MSEYTGKINLIDMSDISQGPPGVGISRTSVMYCSYKSGLIPPDLERIDLTTTSNQIIDFASTGASFRIINGILWAQVEGIDTQLSTASDLITGINGWSPIFPGAQPGQYLWTKTIYYYTDDTQVVTYGVSRQGEDGIQGPQGPMGVSPSFYHLKCNQTEILMFEEDEGVVFSPEELTVSVYKDTPDGESSQQQIRNLTKENFKIEFFTSAGLQEVSESYINLQNDQFEINVENLVNGLNLPEVTLMIDYIHSEGEQEYNLSAEVRVRYGMNKDMAQLSVNAGNIVASMQKSQLVFGGDGLTIKNGSFKIIDTENVDENGKPISLLYADDDGNLTLEGCIKAESGYFKGDITSAQGTIGGFEIKGNTFISTKTEKGVPYITLDGENGSIKAQNIELGIGAKISDYIMLGNNVKLTGKKTGTKPLEFLTIENEGKKVISFSEKGNIKVGADQSNCIVIDGESGSIYTQNFSAGAGWKIDPQLSTFNNVAIRGSISACVFEYGEIQTIGGMMLIRPSSKIKSQKIIVFTDENNNSREVTQIFVENATTFVAPKGEEENRYCIIKDLESIYKVLAVQADDESEHWVILDSKIEQDYVGSPLTLLGKNGEIGIGINSSNITTPMPATSMSVFEFQSGKSDQNQNDTVHTLTPHIILGKLPNDSKYGAAAGTYGLYAENVRLTGSLVTQSIEGAACSGITTSYGSLENKPISSVLRDHFGEAFLPSEILLWAGATGDSIGEIEKSNFFVDRDGNMYAGKALLRGSIITEATITASEIVTAKIIGNGTNGNPALLIEDTVNGIWFRGTKEGDTKESFKVGYDSFEVNIDSINLNKSLKINNNQITFFDDILINDEYLGFMANNILGQKEVASYIKQDSINGLGFYVNGNSMITMKINDSIPTIEAKTKTRFIQDIEYGEKGKITYKPATDQEGEVIGYDLFVD